MLRAADTAPPWPEKNVTACRKSVIPLDLPLINDTEATASSLMSGGESPTAMKEATTLVTS